ncbi:MAG: hypothetical protein ACI9XP_001835 [Lentimonas sp.]|jgi:hypothetical protein
MKKYFSFLLVLLSFCFTSCIEIVDDLKVNNDGSGTFKYTVNLSESRIKINSILALDSLNGKPIPSKSEITDRIVKFKDRFITKEGISNVNLEMDMENFLIKLQIDFQNISVLQDAIRQTIQEESKSENDLLTKGFDWLKWNQDTLARSVPDLSIDKVKELKLDEIEKLKGGSYISITRFERPIIGFSNEKAQLSKNKLALMFKENAYSLSVNPSLLKNTIYLSPLN